MAKYELTKSVEGVKVNKRSGIPTNEKVTVSFGAIIEDPREERDCLRFLLSHYVPSRNLNCNFWRLLIRLT